MNTIKKIKKYLKWNKLFWLFLVAVIFAAIGTTLIASLFGNDVCNSSINPFEDRHCGTEGKTMEEIRNEENNYLSWDLTMHPQALLYPLIFQVLRVYDDVYVEFHVFNPWDNFQLWLIAPWFSMEIDTHLSYPSLWERTVLVILLLLNFCYYGFLAYVFNWLWKNRRWWGKAIVLLFIAVKVLPFMVFLVLSR
jgi:hypothetical protein